MIQFTEQDMNLASELASTESPLLADLTDAQVDSMPSSAGLGTATLGGLLAESQEDLQRMQQEQRNSIVQSFEDRLVATISWPDLATLINDWAVWKGWYETERSSRMFALLFESEVFEAFEEFRKGAFETYFSDDRGYQKPEGYWIEIADVAIRALDYCGHTFGDQAGWWGYPKTAFNVTDWKDHEAVLWQLKSSCWVSIDSLRSLLAICKIYCEENGQNLRSLIDLKMRYNLVREHRHGNKAF